MNRNINSLGTSLKIDRLESFAMADEVERQRDNEREEREWQEFKEAQCGALGILGEQCIRPRGHHGFHESEMKSRWEGI